MTTAGTAAAARGRATLPWMLLAVAGTAAFARPMPVAAFLAWLTADRTPLLPRRTVH